MAQHAATLVVSGFTFSSGRAKSWQGALHLVLFAAFLSLVFAG